MRKGRRLPLRELLLRCAALTDRSMLGASIEDGKDVQAVRSVVLALALADHDRERQV